jgi:hypothetical protein
MGSLRCSNGRRFESFTAHRLARKSGDFGAVGGLREAAVCRSRTCRERRRESQLIA